MIHYCEVCKKHIRDCGRLRYFRYYYHKRTKILVCSKCFAGLLIMRHFARHEHAMNKNQAELENML